MSHAWIAGTCPAFDHALEHTEEALKNLLKKNISLRTIA